MAPKRILKGDCREQLAKLADCSVDSIVTDPPYELGFMGKQWDASGVAYDATLWAECLRVLKPGGHLLAFGGTRTYHRMAVAIEDAGFEVRDSIHWVYGTGFPKSLDVSKAIDKQRHDRADIYRVTSWICERRDTAGITNKTIDDAFGFSGMAGHWTSSKSQPAVPTLEQVPALLEVLGVALDDVPADIRQLLCDLNGRKGQPGENWAKRKVTGTKPSSLGGTVAARERDQRFIDEHKNKVVNISAPATDAARQWEGWGTALKPAHEPIVVARKPLAGTVAMNVLEHGTGALNIDACRVGDADGTTRGSGSTHLSPQGAFTTGHSVVSTGSGRWPANFVLTHAAACGDTCVAGCPVAELVAQGAGASRFFTTTEWDPIADTPFRYIAKPSRAERDAGLDGAAPQRHADRAKADGPGDDNPRNRTNAAQKNHHPTVKPVALMRWLVRLVTPPGGLVLDPFLGSGTTAVAAILEGFEWVGCEMTDDYLPIIRARTAWARKQARRAVQLTLDDGAA